MTVAPYLPHEIDALANAERLWETFRVYGAMYGVSPESHIMPAEPPIHKSALRDLEGAIDDLLDAVRTAESAAGDLRELLREATQK